MPIHTAKSEGVDSLCMRRNQTLSLYGCSSCCSIHLQVNVRGEIGEMLGQGRTAATGPVTRVLVRQPNPMLSTHARTPSSALCVCRQSLQRRCRPALLPSHIAFAGAFWQVTNASKDSEAAAVEGDPLAARPSPRKSERLTSLQVCCSSGCCVSASCSCLSASSCLPAFSVDGLPAGLSVFAHVCVSVSLDRPGRESLIPCLPANTAGQVI